MRVDVIRSAWRCYRGTARRGKSDILSQLPTSTQEGAPFLRRRSTSLHHLLRDAGLTDVEAEFEQLAMNARRTPTRSQRHSREFEIKRSPYRAPPKGSATKTKNGVVSRDALHRASPDPEGLGYLQHTHALCTGRSRPAGLPSERRKRTEAAATVEK